MPLLTLLAGVLVRLCGSLLVKLLVWLGFTAVTFVGTQTLTNVVVSQIGAMAQGLPAVAFQVMGLLKLDLALSIILSAYAFRFARSVGSLSGVRKLASGILKR